MAIKTKSVEVAVRDPANAQRFIKEMKDVECVRINIRLRDTIVAGRVFNDLVCGGVFFSAGETKTLEVSEAAVTEIRNRRDGPWELVPGGKQ